jgi:hypothetical protein
MSQRPCQFPAVMAVHDGVSQAISTPSRSAIAVATAMSKPSYSPVSVFSDDCGGYAGSVDTRTTPSSQILASRSPALVSALAHTVSAVAEPVSPFAVSAGSSLPHAAPTNDNVATSKMIDRNLRIIPPSRGDARSTCPPRRTICLRAYPGNAARFAPRHGLRRLGCSGFDRGAKRLTPAAGAIACRRPRTSPGARRRARPGRRTRSCGRRRRSR